MVNIHRPSVSLYKDPTGKMARGNHFSHKIMTNDGTALDILTGVRSPCSSVLSARSVSTLNHNVSGYSINPSCPTYCGHTAVDHSLLWIDLSQAPSV